MSSGHNKINQNLQILWYYLKILRYCLRNVKDHSQQFFIFFSGVAFSQCDTKVCNADEVCKVDSGEETCEPEFGSYCWVVGDPHYRTFDGIQYDFEGNCGYTMSKSTSEEDGLIPFNIEAKNENRGNNQVSFVGLVKLFVYGNKIAIYRQERGFVQVGHWASSFDIWSLVDYFFLSGIIIIFLICKGRPTIIYICKISSLYRLLGFEIFVSNDNCIQIDFAEETLNSTQWTAQVKKKNLLFYLV